MHRKLDRPTAYRLKLTLEERPSGASGWYNVSTADRPTHNRTTRLDGWTKQQALDGFDQVESMLDSDFVADLVECANECDEADRDHQAHITKQDDLEV